MKTGKITAKLRDAVPVCLMVNGEEMQQYKNIELPDELKELEMKDFHFNVPMDGKITFQIHYEQGILPEIFPEPRGKKTRTAKAEAKAAQEAAETETAAEPAEQSEDSSIPAEPVEESGNEAPPAEPTEESGSMEIAFNLIGIRRKELVVAVSDFIGAEPEYKAAPSFAYEIGDYTVNKEGTLTGAANQPLLDALAEKGFTSAE